VCVKIGAQLTRPEELLLRHVRPVWLDDEASEQPGVLAVS
jgi:hypothetical protein